MIEKTKDFLKTPLVREEEPDGYASVLEHIASKVRAAQARAIRAVNLELIIERLVEQLMKSS